MQAAAEGLDCFAALAMTWLGREFRPSGRHREEQRDQAIQAAPMLDRIASGASAPSFT
jgi:hypothetical protein